MPDITTELFKGLDEMLMRPDYSDIKNRKKYVDAVFDVEVEVFEEVIGEAGVGGLKGFVLQNRKAAILNTIDRLVKDYGNLPNHSIVESFARFESISYDTYDLSLIHI